jgi:SAM-dependent methyltransferase
MDKLKKFYKNKFLLYGASIKGVGWYNSSKAKKRYKNLLRIIDTKNKSKFSLLDVGCGYGELLNYCNFKKLRSYQGIDLVDEMINYAIIKHKDNNKIKFNVRNLFHEKKKYDYVICNGIFTLKSSLTNQDMFNYVKKCINHFYKISRKGFAFNVMSEKVDFKSKDLFYIKNDKLVSFLNSNKEINIKVDRKCLAFENYFFIKK